MTPAEIRDFKIELLDEIFELASDPIADPEPVRERIEAFFAELEKTRGKER